MLARLKQLTGPLVAAATTATLLLFLAALDEFFRAPFYYTIPCLAFICNAAAICQAWRKRAARRLSGPLPGAEITPPSPQEIRASLSMIGVVAWGFPCAAKSKQATEVNYAANRKAA